MAQVSNCSSGRVRVKPQRGYPVQCNTGFILAVHDVNDLKKPIERIGLHFIGTQMGHT